MKDNSSGGAEMWNERFANNKFLYTKEPNVQFAEYLKNKPPGKILLPGDGEGRNGVYAAKLGWEVVSFDYSNTAVSHARELAKEYDVKTNAQISSVENFHFEPHYFDLIAMMFFHLPSSTRKIHFPRLLEYLKPQGEIFILGFSKSQINNDSGGPKDLDMLYSTAELENEFTKVLIIKNVEREIWIDEGPKHRGKAHIVEFLATV